MARALVTNNAIGALASGINNSATTVVLTAGQGALFPSPTGGDFFYCTIIDASNNKEIVKCTARATDTLTVVRAQDGTTARSFIATARVELRDTAALHDLYPQLAYANTFTADQTITGSLAVSATITGVTLKGTTVELGLGATDTTLSRSAAGVAAIEGVDLAFNSITKALACLSLDIGHASDCTITRVSAGVIAVEGNVLSSVGGALGTPPSGTLTNCTGLPISGLVASTSTALGVGSVELGHASDTTLSRSAAGVLAVEGVTVALNSITAAAHIAASIELGHLTDTTITRTGAGAIAVEGVQVLLSGAALGTPASGTLTNCTGLPISGLVASTSTALGVGSVELGHASDTTLARSSAGHISVEGSVVQLASDLASAANMEAQTSAKIVTADILNRHPHVAKAIAIFTVSGATVTLKTASKNISGVVKDGTGLFTVSFTTDFSSADYGVVGTAERSAGSFVTVRDGLKAAGSVGVRVSNQSDTAVDPTSLTVICYGDQT